MWYMCKVCVCRSANAWWGCRTNQEWVTDSCIFSNTIRESTLTPALSFKRLCFLSHIKSSLDTEHSKKKTLPLGRKHQLFRSLSVSIEVGHQFRRHCCLAETLDLCICCFTKTTWILWSDFTDCFKRCPHPTGLSMVLAALLCKIAYSCFPHSFQVIESRKQPLLGGK